MSGAGLIGAGSALQSFGESMLKYSMSKMEDKRWEEKQKFLKKLEEDNDKKIPKEKIPDYARKVWILRNKFGDLIREEPMLPSEVEDRELSQRKDKAEVLKSEAAQKKSEFDVLHQEEDRNLDVQIKKSALGVQAQQILESKDRIRERQENNPTNWNDARKDSERAKMLNARIKQILESNPDLKDEPGGRDLAKQQAMQELREEAPALGWPEEAPQPTDTGAFGGALGSALKGFVDRAAGGPEPSAAPQQNQAALERGADEYAKLAKEYRELEGAATTNPQAALRREQIKQRLRQLGR